MQLARSSFRSFAPANTRLLCRFGQLTMDQRSTTICDAQVTAGYRHISLWVGSRYYMPTLIISWVESRWEQNKNNFKKYRKEVQSCSVNTVNDSEPITPEDIMTFPKAAPRKKAGARFSLTLQSGSRWLYNRKLKTDRVLMSVTQKFRKKKAKKSSGKNKTVDTKNKKTAQVPLSQALRPPLYSSQPLLWLTSCHLMLSFWIHPHLALSPLCQLLRLMQPRRQLLPPLSLLLSHSRPPRIPCCIPSCCLLLPLQPLHSGCPFCSIHFHSSCFHSTPFLLAYSFSYASVSGAGRPRGVSSCVPGATGCSTRPQSSSCLFSRPSPCLWFPQFCLVNSVSSTQPDDRPLPTVHCSRSPLHPIPEACAIPPMPDLSFRLDTPADYLYWLFLRCRIKSGHATASQTSRFAQIDASLCSQLAWDSSTLAGAADASFDQLLESLGPLFATWSIAGRRPSL